MQGAVRIPERKDMVAFPSLGPVNLPVHSAVFPVAVGIQAGRKGRMIEGGIKDAHRFGIALHLDFGKVRLPGTPRGFAQQVEGEDSLGLPIAFAFQIGTGICLGHRRDAYAHHQFPGPGLAGGPAESQQGSRARRLIPDTDFGQRTGKFHIKVNDLVGGPAPGAAESLHGILPHLAQFRTKDRIARAKVDDQLRHRFLGIGIAVYADPPADCQLGLDIPAVQMDTVVTRISFFAGVREGRLVILF